MNHRMIVLTVAAAVLCGGAACPTREEAALNRRNRDLGVELSTHAEPAVAVRGAEVAANAETLDHTTFEGVEAAPTPTTPEESAAMRQEAVDRRQTEQGFWSAAKGLLGSTPWGAAILGGLTTVGGCLAWVREFFRRKAVRKGLEATARAVDVYRDGGLKEALGSVVTDKALLELVSNKGREYLRKLLENEQTKAGAKADVEKLLKAARNGA